MDNDSFIRCEILRIEQAISIDQQKQEHDYVWLGSLIFLGLSFCVLFVWYLFWDGGFEFFMPVIHNEMVNLVAAIPGPHVALLRADYLADGYVSAIDLHRYISMAQNNLVSR